MGEDVEMEGYGAVRVGLEMEMGGEEALEGLGEFGCASVVVVVGFLLVL